MKNKNKLRMQTNILMGVIGILLLLSFVSAIGVTSDYSDENHATIGPGETRIINILRLLNSGGEIVKIKIELIDGAGVASYTGQSEIEVAPDGKAEIPINVIIPKDTHDETKYDLTFKFSDITPSSGEGMVSFGKATTITTPIYVKKPFVEPSVTPSVIPSVEKPATGNYIWYILVFVIIVIIVIVVYLLLRKKKKR